MLKEKWEWLKKNHRSIIAFVFILAMGAGIAPTISRGRAFVEALQFEEMAEKSPAYAVVRDVESQTRYYVLSVEVLDDIAVLWILSPNENVDYDEIDKDLYVMFTSLAENYSAETYLIIEAWGAISPSMNGYVIAFRGVGYYALTSEGMDMLIDAGIADINDTLSALHALEVFGAQSLEQQGAYMTNLLPRAPEHVPPWEEE